MRRPCRNRNFFSSVQRSRDLSWIDRGTSCSSSSNKHQHPSRSRSESCCYHHHQVQTVLRGLCVPQHTATKVLYMLEHSLHHMPCCSCQSDAKAEPPARIYRLRCAAEYQNSSSSSSSKPVI